MTSRDRGPVAPPSRPALVAAFAAVYVIWGSTYLAILVALETLPPFAMAGLRFAAAGSILYAWTRWRGAAPPTPAQWGWGVAVGGLLLLGGNGSVVWAEQRVASGTAALVIATVPAWMVLIDWLLPGGRRPSAPVTAGVVMGFAGVAWLVAGPRDPAAVDPVGATVLVLGAACWASGSLLSRRVHWPSSPLLATSLPMLGGGALLLVVGAASGELRRIDLAAASARSLVATAYLVIFGSLIAFSCYAWLLRVTTPARVATYAFVNPVVAVALGVLAGEALPPRMLAAGAIIVGAVALIVIAPSAAPPLPRAPAVTSGRGGTTG